MQIVTEHLLLRRPWPDGLDAMHEIMSDPRAMLGFVETGRVENTFLMA